MLEALIALVGVLVGFLLNEGATRIRDARNEGERLRLVRAVIRLEIDQNIALLQALLDKINSPTGDYANPTRLAVLRFVEFPNPDWKRHGYFSQLQSLPAALNQVELLAVIHFYNQLDRLDAIKGTLTDSVVGSEHTRNVPVRISFVENEGFEDKTKTYWPTAKTIIDELVKSGNPLLEIQKS